MARRLPLIAAAAIALMIPMTITASGHDAGSGMTPAHYGGGMGPGGMGYGGMGYGGMGYGGMMGPGMMGPGMMGPGGWGYMGPAMMGPNGDDDARRPMPGWQGGMMGGPWMNGPGMYRWQDLSVDDVRHYLGHMLEWRGNKRLKLGAVKEKDKDVIVADIVTAKEGALVDRLAVDRHTGAIGRIQ